MPEEEDDKSDKTGQATSGGTAQPAKSGGQEDTPRYSTKEDARATKTETGGGSSEPQDRPRDGS